MGELLTMPRTARPPRRARPEPLWREVLGERLRDLRHDRGSTLVETSERAGISPQYLSEVERGLKDPSSEVVAAVAGALGTSVLDLSAAVVEDLRSSARLADLGSSGGPVAHLRAA
jgi:transcriptional regulator with XRE-family HTH domain